MGVVIRYIHMSREDIAAHVVTKTARGRLWLVLGSLVHNVPSLQNARSITGTFTSMESLVKVSHDPSGCGHLPSGRV